MCGRMTLGSPAEVLRKRFRVEMPTNFTQRYNVCPSEGILTIAMNREGQRQLIRMRWGFIPYWETEAKTKLSTINAKVETLARSAIYGRAFHRRRCLVIADGFYEWKRVPGGKKGPKQPYWIHRKDGEPFAFAGIYSVWRPKGQSESDPVLSCAIVTTPAKGVVEPIHNRMPVILKPAAESAWIDRTVQNAEEIHGLLEPEDPAELESRPVSTLVNSPENEGRELLLEQPQPV